MSSSNPKIEEVTQAVRDFLKGGVAERLREMLEAIDARTFDNLEQNASSAHAGLEASRTATMNEDRLNGLYVAHAVVRLIHWYCLTWKRIYRGEHANSWNSLQDALDAIRTVKRFSLVDVSHAEEQLVELETAYPYKIFFSMGATVGYFECSICGADIDSFECLHRRGNLYAGVLAYGTAKDGLQIDHIAAVQHPQDKRCVPVYPDTGPQFQIVRYIGNLLKKQTLIPSAFSGMDWSTTSEPNPEHIKQGRNDRCRCGSGKKYKKCCIEKATVEKEHVDVCANGIYKVRDIVV